MYRSGIEHYSHTTYIHSCLIIPLTHPARLARVRVRGANLSPSPPYARRLMEGPQRPHDCCGTCARSVWLTIRTGLVNHSGHPPDCPWRYVRHRVSEGCTHHRPRLATGRGNVPSYTRAAVDYSGSPPEPGVIWDNICRTSLTCPAEGNDTGREIRQTPPSHPG